MLAHVTGEGWELGEVSAQLKRCAATRQGEWEVRSVDEDGDLVTVVYTEKEWAKLFHFAVHGLRNETKKTALYGNMEQNAQWLWPTGSLEHVALRHLGVTLALRYVSGHVGERHRWFTYPGPNLVRSVGGYAAMYASRMCKRRHEYRTQLFRRYPRSDGQIRISSAVGTPDVAPPVEDPPKGPDPEAPPTRKDASTNTEIEDLPPPLPAQTPPEHGGATPEDAVNLAETVDDRTVVHGRLIGIIGQDFDKTVPKDRAPIVGVVIGPHAAPPNVYSNTAKNTEDAKIQRLDLKYVKPDIDDKLDRKIGEVVRRSMFGDPELAWCSKERIHAWCTSNFNNLADLKSGKWSTERFERSMTQLISQPSPWVKHNLAVKAECMPEGKAPRMLIADGDAGQLMGLATVKCFEDLLFTHFEQQSIKHLPKRDAIQRVTDHLMKKDSNVCYSGKVSLDYCGTIEGDGTAWDTTCNKEIRDKVENPILAHIMEVIMEYGVVPPQWHEAYHAANTKSKIKGWFSNKYESLCLSFDAIRRSGDRKTSSGNYWMNRVMMSCALFKDPWTFLHPKRKWGVMDDGTKRWCYFAFEGDDSIVSLCPPMQEDSKLAESFLDTWKRAGFRMKIVFCDARATFVGYHIACDRGRAMAVYCPELPRSLKSAGISVSQMGIKAFKEDDENTMLQLSAASHLARAADFAGILPTVSQKYLDFALSCDASNFHEREMSMRAQGSDGLSSHALAERINQLNLGVTLHDEMYTLEILGYGVNDLEHDQFRSYIWDWTNKDDWQAFRRSLPETWRC